MSWVLQYLVGLHQLGHEIYFVEKSGWRNSCFNPVRNVMTDDCGYGVKTVHELLSRFGLGDRWCFVNATDEYYGLSQKEIESVFESADLFIDMGTHGSWLDEAKSSGVCIMIDGEPGFTQMKMAKRLENGEKLPTYDYYYSTGRNIGTRYSSAPTASIQWRHLYHPVFVNLFKCTPGSRNGPFTTVMNWQSYEPLTYNGQTYGHKDVEFAQFMRLPRMTDHPLEVAVSGKHTPISQLHENGWRVSDGHDVTLSFDSFLAYICNSTGEFSVCKSGYVRHNTGWFSDRSAAYLASGRPVILQDTGFSQHLPCGQGLFAVRTSYDAVGAIEEICGNYQLHSKRARELAAEYLDVSIILPKFLSEVGV